MIRVDVRSDISKALRKFDVTAQQAKRAVAQALNKTAAQARTQAGRDIRNEGYGIKSGTIKGAITILRASYSELRAVVRASGRPIPLIAYGARQTLRGVTVSVKNGRKLIKGAFIATMPTGHKGVFTRKGTGHKWVTRGGRRYESGLPIDELFGPSVPSAFANDVVQRSLERMVRERFPRLLKSQLQFVSSKH